MTDWKAWARRLLEREGRTVAHRAVLIGSHELARMAIARGDLEALRDERNRLDSAARVSSYHWRNTVWMHQFCIDDTPREACVPTACLVVAPLPEHCSVRTFYEQNPAQLHGGFERLSLWTQWMQGDDCLGCASGADDTRDYWSRVYDRDGESSAASSLVFLQGVQ